MSEQVTAEVILRNAAGLSILDETGPITADTIAKYRVEKEVVDEVTRRMNELGFTVLQSGPTSLTITGDKYRFESVFQTTLEPRSQGLLGAETEGAEVAYFEATEPIVVPAILSEQVADVVLPTPPELFP